MAVNGVSAPKFIYNYGGDSAIIILLDYAFSTEVKYESGYINQQSVFNLERDSMLLGTHVEFVCHLNLFKYADPKTKLSTLEQYKGLKVVLYQHRDGFFFFKDLLGNPALFLLEEVEPYHLEDVTYKDAVKLTFKSMNKVVINPGYIL